MKDREILNSYIPLVDFLAQITGPSAEIVLHDISTPQNSVIAIKNGEAHSGRKIGDPLTDLSLEIIKSNKSKKDDFISNYKATAQGKEFISSTFFIKNNEKLIGLLCVNRSLEPLKELNVLFEAIKKQYNLVPASKENSTKENLDPPVNVFLEEMITNAIEKVGVIPARMSVDEKVKVIHELKTQGVLSMKESVPAVSKHLNISIPTVYRYIKKAQE